MILLIDLDSILYASVYRLVSIKDMRDAIDNYGKENAKQWLREIVYNEGLDRCENSIQSIRDFVQNNYFEEITGVETYITTCTNSFRKAISPSYKANRRPNKYVWMLRHHYAMNGAFSSDTHEADDLIANRARELGIGNYVICSIDKDLKQIGGHYWSYYRHKIKGEDGEFVVNEFGYNETEYKQKQIDFITPEEADLLFWKQMLVGDTADNIAGLKKVGEKTAEKILQTSVCHFVTVARQYINRGQKEDFWTNYKLLKL